MKKCFGPLCLLALATPAFAQTQQPSNDPVRTLVQRLALEKKQATTQGPTQSGDPRQGTARYRAAIDWIEKQLKSYGCANTERLKYQFGDEPPHRVVPATAASGSAQSNAPLFNVGGARARGIRNPTGVNPNPRAKPDPVLRALDTPPAVAGDREEVWCTKIGATNPGE